MSHDDAYEAILVPPDEGALIVGRELPCEFLVAADNFPIYVTRGDNVASS